MTEPRKPYRAMKLEKGVPTVSCTITPIGVLVVIPGVYSQARPKHQYMLYRTDADGPHGAIVEMDEPITSATVEMDGRTWNVNDAADGPPLPTLPPGYRYAAKPEQPK